MNTPEANPFETIESAHRFMALLSEAVSEAKQEIQSDVHREASGNEARRMEALRMALYSLEKLEVHVNRSSRLLNDLRTLRRLLFSERTKPINEQTLSPSNAGNRPREQDEVVVGEDRDGFAVGQSA